MAPGSALRLAIRSEAEGVFGFVGQELCLDAAGARDHGVEHDSTAVVGALRLGQLGEAEQAALAVEIDEPLDGPAVAGAGT